MISKIKYLFEFSDLTIERIAEEVGLTFKQVYTQISKLYTKEERQTRKKQCYRNSKLGYFNDEPELLIKASEYLNVCEL